MKTNDTFLEKRTIDSIRALAIDMIDNAKSGHPGIALGAAPMLYTLYLKHINVNVDDDKWINRDRFIMSAGHGSSLLYCLLFFAGLNLSLDDLKSFRKIDSITPGHPEYDVTKYVDMSTGPLGQGFASAVGVSIAEKFYSANFNINNCNIIDYYTYVLCSDGDLMEGISYEAASLAGTLRLGKLIVLYDSNNISLDGDTDLSFTENVLKRFEALGWHTQLVDDGEKVDEIDNAILNAKSVLDKPSIIEVKTVIGRGSIKQGTNTVHGAPLSEEDILQFKTKNNIRNVPFDISNELVLEFRDYFTDRCKSNYNNWKKQHENFERIASDDLNKKLGSILSNNINIDIQKLFSDFSFENKEEMRKTNGKIMDVISENVFPLLGGSADLISSTKTYLSKFPVFSKENYIGKNIYFGVREHSMGAILNGLAISGLRPFGSTFLAFSDYVKPAIRMSALMDIPVIYIFTHDNITIGADGPTHQPIEQLFMLRSIPNFNVYRPADGKEIVGCWNEILTDNKPCALIVSKNETNLLSDTNVELVNKGAYIVRKENNKLSGVIIATGTEVDLALKVALKLEPKGIDIRVISMPCVEKFEKQNEEYKESLIPSDYKTIVIEFSSSNGWYKYAYNSKYLITLDEFGKSGTKDELIKEFEIDFDFILSKVERLFR